WAADDLPVWAPRRELRCAAVEALRAASAQRRAEEYNRLLYVALTRAEDRLLVCGWQTGRALAETCWYETVRRGFEALGAEMLPGPWDGEMRRLASPQLEDPKPEPVAEARGGGILPGWVAAAPPTEPALPVHLAPSRPE